MTSYLLEVYTPATAALEPIETAARRAAAAITASGTSVRYVRSIFVPLDEICFHLLEAPSAEAVHEVAGRAGIVAQRILEAAGGEPVNRPPATTSAACDETHIT
jgi:Protein of unknown function (DUF4242)